MFNIGLEQFQLPHLEYNRADLHSTVRFRKHPASENFAVMIEVEPINRKQDLVCQLIILLPLLLRRVHPVLQLRFTDDCVAVQLVASTHKHMERLFIVFLHQVCPNGVVTRLEARSTEIIGIDSSRKSVALFTARGVWTEI